MGASNLCDSRSSCKLLLDKYKSFVGIIGSKKFDKVYDEIMSEAKTFEYFECYRTIGDKKKCMGNIKVSSEVLKPVVAAEDDVIASASNIGQEGLVNCIKKRGKQNRLECIGEIKEKMQKDGIVYKPENVRKLATGRIARKIYKSCLENEGNECFLSDTVDSLCINYALNNSIMMNMSQTLTESFDGFISAARVEMYRNNYEKDTCNKSESLSQREFQEINQQLYSKEISKCDESKVNFLECLEKAEEAYQSLESKTDEANDNGRNLQYVRKRVASSYALDRSLDICDGNDKYACAQSREQLCKTFTDENEAQSGECWVNLKREKLRRVIERCSKLKVDNCGDLVRKEIPEAFFTDNPEDDSDFKDILSNIGKKMHFTKSNRFLVRMKMKECSSMSLRATIHTQNMKMHLQDSSLQTVCKTIEYDKENCYAACEIGFPKQFTDAKVESIFKKIKSLVPMLLETKTSFRISARRLQTTSIDLSEYTDLVAAQGINDNIELDSNNADSNPNDRITAQDASMGQRTISSCTLLVTLSTALHFIGTVNRLL